MDTDVVKHLARKIGKESEKIFGKANNIILTSSTSSPDKWLKEHYAKTNKSNIKDIIHRIHKLEEYAEELEAHIYDGEVNDE